MTRTVLRAVLASGGFKLAGEASTIKLGMEQALKLKPHIICLDILLPDGNGVDMLKELTQKIPETIVLMVTGKRDAGTIKDCLQSGAKGFILKPFNAATVLQTLKNAVVKAAESRAANKKSSA
jgi:two-component system, chemotaxis family, chemotaxis protein CheY